MERQGLAPTLYHYNCAFSACEKALRWKEAAALFRRLRAKGVRPTALSYSALISVLERCQKRKQAVAVLEVRRGKRG